MGQISFAKRVRCSIVHAQGFMTKIIVNHPTMRLTAIMCVKDDLQSCRDCSEAKTSVPGTSKQLGG